MCREQICGWNKYFIAHENSVIVLTRHGNKNIRGFTENIRGFSPLSPPLAPPLHISIITTHVVITSKICRYNEKRSRYNDIIEWKKYYVGGSITSPYISNNFVIILVLWFDSFTLNFWLYFSPSVMVSPSNSFCSQTYSFPYALSVYSPILPYPCTVS